MYKGDGALFLLLSPQNAAIGELKQSTSGIHAAKQNRKE
jgi:hypothetical protein